MSETNKSSAEGEIEELLERYLNLARISTDWFWETNENFVITYMSDSVERITGFTKDNYIGVSRYDLASEETKKTDEWKAHVEQIANHEPIKNFEYKHVGEDGYVVYLRVNAVPLFRDDGTFRGYLGSTTDISELIIAIKQAEEANLALQAKTTQLEVAKMVAEEMARTDALTGLNNRRAFFEQGKAIDDLSSRYGQGYSVIMMDIDFFKKINDTYGHAIGDIAIKHVADKLAKHARTSDVPARIGGEEFALILPQTPADSAKTLAERLRIAIEETSIPLEKDSLTFTISMGVAQCCEEEGSIEGTLALADEALYVAKTQGRNQVVMAGA